MQNRLSRDITRLQKTTCPATMMTTIAFITLFFCCSSFPVFATEAAPAPPSESSLEPLTLEPLTLERALILARENNLTTRMVRESIRSAEAQVTQARSAALPQLQLQAAYVRLDEQPAMDFAGTRFIMGQQNNYEATLSASQVIFAGGGVYNTIKQATHARDAAIYDSARMDETIMYQTLVLFNSVLLAREQVKVADTALNMAEVNLGDVQSRYDHGMARKFDLIRAGELVSRNTALLESARNTLANTRVQLANFLRLDPSHTLNITGELTVDSLEVDRETAMETALSNRSDLKRIQSLVQLQQAAKNVSRSGFLPTIALFGEYTQANPDKTYADAWDDSWQAGVQITFSLFDGGHTLGKLREADAELRKMQMAALQLRDTVHEEVAIAVNNLDTASAVLNAQAMNVAQSEEALRLARTTFKEGLLPQIDVLNAQLSCTGSRQQYAKAVFDHTLAVAQVKYAMGALRNDKSND